MSWGAPGQRPQYVSVFLFLNWLISMICDIGSLTFNLYIYRLIHPKLMCVFLSDIESKVALK